MKTSPIEASTQNESLLDCRLPISTSNHRNDPSSSILNAYKLAKYFIVFRNRKIDKNKFRQFILFDHENPIEGELFIVTNKTTKNKIYRSERAISHYVTSLYVKNALGITIYRNEKIFFSIVKRKVTKCWRNFGVRVKIYWWVNDINGARISSWIEEFACYLSSKIKQLKDPEALSWVSFKTTTQLAFADTKKAIEHMINFSISFIPPVLPQNRI